MYARSAAAAAAVVAALAFNANAAVSFTYQHDDGSPETGAGPASGGTTGNGFQVTGGNSFITGVQARAFAQVANDYTITATLWTDPTGGSPDDATRIAVAQDTLHMNGDTWFTIDFDSPMDVGPDGSFFFVALTIGNNVVYAVDTSSHHTYFQSTGTTVPTSLHNMSSLPPGTAFIRAIAVPTPGAAVLFTLGGLVAVRRRR